MNKLMKDELTNMAKELVINNERNRALVDELEKSGSLTHSEAEWLKLIITIRVRDEIRQLRKLCESN